MNGKRILLGISGGIAAYKCCTLVRLLVTSGAHVQVIMTPDATQFVSPLTLSVLSKNKVYSTFTNQDLEWNNHVKLALEADLFLIAPATANTIGKMAQGICDNLLLTTYFSSKCPIMLAPAMDLDMYQHHTISENINKLQKLGTIIIPAEEGELASGLYGQGRMAEPENIMLQLEHFFKPTTKLIGKKVLVTAGPTYEKIDPVRFIGNHSSGKMGLAIAKAFIAQGAHVTLICGPGVPALPSNNLLHLINISTAQEMYLACIEHFKESDITVMAAAVADYRPEHSVEQKIKKTTEQISLSLVKNPDILLNLGTKKNKRQLLIGFALETHNEENFAQEKLKKKNLDMIVLNSLNDIGAGFGTDTNKVSFVFNNKKMRVLPLMSKEKVAYELVQEIISLTL